MSKQRIMNKVSPKEQSICIVKDCNEVIKTPMTQEGHNVLYHSEVIDHYISCPFDGCNCKFARKKDLDSHINSIHAPSHGLPKNYLCKAVGCNMRYAKGSQLMEHAQQEHGIEISLHPCPIDECDQEFTKPESIANHLSRVHKIKFTCNVCSKVLKTQSALEAHLQRSHNPDNQFVCNEPTCSRRYSTKSTCTYHERKHSHGK
ncbi:hypothetical protein BCR43DRAFT_482594 [Syncephalastrum racemosum]|uniref:C2H2-type domain-containing protein n=1 Tax=Syncephalastrum racemosum TaxID=13706 RepID=A0A1X2HTU7_SYNRA|nr:hypothetical protein BCR43DRAFT_482594 [Syncephalastrum racemosum]